MLFNSYIPQFTITFWLALTECLCLQAWVRQLETPAQTSTTCGSHWAINLKLQYFILCFMNFVHCVNLKNLHLLIRLSQISTFSTRTKCLMKLLWPLLWIYTTKKKRFIYCFNTPEQEVVRLKNTFFRTIFLITRVKSEVLKPSPSMWILFIFFFLWTFSQIFAIRNT